MEKTKLVVGEEDIQVDYGYGICEKNLRRG